MLFIINLCFRYTDTPFMKYTQNFTTAVIYPYGVLFAFLIIYPYRVFVNKNLSEQKIMITVWVRQNTLPIAKYKPTLLYPGNCCSSKIFF